MLHDNVDDFLAAFPEGEIIAINPLDFKHPEEIILVPCTEHGDENHRGELLPGPFRMVMLRRRPKKGKDKEEPQPNV